MLASGQLYFDSFPRLRYEILMLRSFSAPRWVKLIFIVVGIVSLIRAARFSFETPRSKNIVLISIDTLRADRLGVYGYQRNTSPVIDQLGNASTVFDRAVTPAPWTLPAHVSMFTGLYPRTHGIQKSRQPIPGSMTLLTQILNRKGYHTIGITGGAFVSKGYGFARGFDNYTEALEYAPNNTNSITIAVDKAKRQLDAVKDGDPFFLFLHSYDVHCPYDAPRDYQMMFQTVGAEPIETNHCGEAFYNRKKISKSHAQYLSDRYDESIRAVDAALEGLFLYLKSRPDYEDTIIVLTSDHGEEFFEHGRIGHQGSVFQELLFVPLIIHVPNAPAQHIEQHVSLIDITPTILDLVKIELLNEVDGVSLAPVVLGGEPPTRFRPFEYSELQRGQTLFSRIGNKSQLIYDPSSGESHLFDLTKDRAEQINLVDSEPEWYQRKHQELLAFVSNSEETLGERDRQKEIGRLKSLGYLQ